MTAIAFDETFARESPIAAPRSTRGARLSAATVAVLFRSGDRLLRDVGLTRQAVLSPFQYWRMETVRDRDIWSL